MRKGSVAKKSTMVRMAYRVNTGEGLKKAKDREEGIHYGELESHTRESDFYIGGYEY